jgi:hypothetical protein
MCSDPFRTFTRLVMLLTALLMGTAMLSCGSDNSEASPKVEPAPAAKTTKASKKNTAPAQPFDAKSAAAEYKLLQYELKLAGTEKPYLEINMPRMQVRVMLKGTPIWDTPLVPDSIEKPDPQDFVDAFRGGDNTLVRPVSRKHLFAAAKKTPDSVLKIVGEVVKVSPDLLQREIPERFQLQWQDGPVLEIRTSVQGEEKDAMKNKLLTISQTLSRPFGDPVLTLVMPPEAALTLYHAITVGLPTIVVTSDRN